MQPRCPLFAGKLRQPAAPAGPCLGFGLGQEPEPDQRIVQLVAVRRLRPGLGADARDRLWIEPPEVGGGLRVEPAPGHDGLRAPLLQRGVVQIGVGPRRQHLQRQRRRLGEVARDHADGAGLDAREQALQALDVHGLGQAVGDRLVHQRVVGHLALAGQVLGAGDLIGKDAADQVLGIHARELRRHLPAAAEARQRQRHAGDPAPARDEHRRVEHGLDQHAADARRVQIARDLAQLEAVRGGERQHDVVLGRRRLQLEVELAAEALAQCQAPGAVDAAAVGRMHDELHAARLVEEALQHDGVLRRQAAERRIGRAQVFDQLECGGLANADLIDQPAQCVLPVRIAPQPLGHVGAEARDRRRQFIAAAGRLAQPERDAG